MENRYCPLCKVILEIRTGDTYTYDPVVSVEVISYFCPVCSYEESIEYLKQIY